jgi:hypothetical protein
MDRAGQLATQWLSDSASDGTVVMGVKKGMICRDFYGVS